MGKMTDLYASRNAPSILFWMQMSWYTDDIRTTFCPCALRLYASLDHPHEKMFHGSICKEMALTPYEIFDVFRNLFLR